MALASRLEAVAGAPALVGTPAFASALAGAPSSAKACQAAAKAADEAGEPSLAEMTGVAIELLSKRDEGFFLMVEAGRIDHGHHAGNAQRALTDTIALSDAVRLALENTKLPRHKVATVAQQSTSRA